MFQNGFIRKEVFLEHISDNGAIWDDTIMVEGIAIHFYFSVDMVTKVQMLMPSDEIPKFTALNWLRQLGLR